MKRGRGDDVPRKGKQKKDPVCFFSPYFHVSKSEKSSWSKSTAFLSTQEFTITLTDTQVDSQVPPLLLELMVESEVGFVSGHSGR